MTNKTIFMRKEDWQKWDDALRSGEYKQGCDQLFNPVDGSYCCLGVLEHCLTGRVESDEDNDMGDDERTNDDDFVLLDNLPSRRWLANHHVRFFGITGRSSRQPFLPRIETSAAVANDRMMADALEGMVHAFPFDAIADAIEDAVEFI